MSQITGLSFKIHEMAGRIRALREIENLTAAEMAQRTGVTLEEYLGRDPASIDFLVRVFNKGSVITTYENTAYDGLLSLARSPSWLPEGKWKIVFLSSDELYLNLKYEDTNRNTILYEESPATVSALSIDTEEAEIEKTLINGSKAILVTKEGQITITWIDDINSLMCKLEITGTSKIANVENAIKIAESIK